MILAVRRVLHKGVGVLETEYMTDIRIAFRRFHIRVSSLTAFREVDPVMVLVSEELGQSVMTP